MVSCRTAHLQPIRADVFRKNFDVFFAFRKFEKSPSKTPHDQPCVTSTPRHPPHPLHPSLVCVCVTSELSSASSPPAAGVAGADFQKASSTRSPQKETAKETGPFLGAQIPTHILGVYTSTNIYVYSINMFLYQNISILR